MTALAILAAVIWLYLLTAHGRFWSAGPSLIPAAPVHYPAVDVVIPARDEAEGITDCLRSLLAQDLPRHAPPDPGRRRQQRRHR